MGNLKYTNIGFEPQVFLEMNNIVGRISLVKNISKGRYVNLAVDILNTIVNSGKLPDDLGELLSKNNPRALRELQNILEAAKTVDMIEEVAEKAGIA